MQINTEKDPRFPDIDDEETGRIEFRVSVSRVARVIENDVVYVTAIDSEDARYIVDTRLRESPESFSWDGDYTIDADEYEIDDMDEA